MGYSKMLLKDILVILYMNIMNPLILLMKLLGNQNFIAHAWNLHFVQVFTDFALHRCFIKLDG